MGEEVGTFQNVELCIRNGMHRKMNQIKLSKIYPKH